MQRAIVRHLAFVLAAVMSAFLMLDGLEETSPTEDEWAHLVRGLQFWHGDDQRLQYAHPPLANAATALPLAFDDNVPSFSQLDGWDSATVGRVAYGYLRLDYDRARGALMRARTASVGLALLGLLYAYLWGVSMLGRREGLVLALLLAFHPTLLAHARHVSTDLPCAVACFIAVGELARHLKGGAPGATWIGVPLGLAAAILCKHSGLLLAPMFVIVTAWYGWSGRGRYAGIPAGRRLSGWGSYALFVASIVLLLVNLAYGWDETGMTVAQVLRHPEPQYWISSPYQGAMLETVSPLGWLPSGLRLPMPYPWLFGVMAVGVQSAQGHPFGSFFGVPNPTGHPAFFPIVCLLKTPLLHLAGGLVAVGSAWRSRSLPRGTSVMAATALGFLAVAATSSLNMGVRHVLPVLYLGTVVVASGLCTLWERVRTRSWLLVVGAALLVGPAFVHRVDGLGYFNVGRTLGHRVCVVGEDLGQDRFRFARWVEARGIEPLYYDTQSRTRALEARWAGLEFAELHCGTTIRPGAYAAVHASRRITIGRGCFSQLVGLEPIATFNDHIDIYRLPRAPHRTSAW